MRSAGRWLLSIGLLWAGLAGEMPARGESPRGLVEEGNRLYQEGRLAEALERYTKAQELAPGSAGIHYNMGNVLYRQGEFEKAYAEYRQAFSAPEPSLAQGARFNAGNSHFARENWPEAIRNYQEALRLDPADIDSKRNLELALLRMQRQEEQKEPREGQQDQQQQQESRQEERQDQRPEDRQESPQQESPDPRDQQQQHQDRKSPAQEKEGLSREEAMRILDAMIEQDRPPQDLLRVPPPDRRPEKDW